MHLGTLAGDLGCFPLDYGADPPQSHCPATFLGIRSLVGFGTPFGALAQSVSLPPRRNARRCTSMHFGENELSRNAIGFSPLSTPHPTVLQHRLVRASRRCYPSFTLGMDRSFRFASAACDFSALVRTRFPYGFAYRLNLAAYHNSLAHFPRGTQSGLPKA